MGQSWIDCMAVNSDKPKLSNPEAPAGPLFDTDDIVQQKLNCSWIAPHEPPCSSWTRGKGKHILGGFLSCCCFPGTWQTDRHQSMQWSNKREGHHERKPKDQALFQAWLWYTKYNPIGMQTLVVAKHIPRRAQGGLQGWTTERKKCTNGSKMEKFCQVRTKIICVPVSTSVKAALLCLWERTYTWTWSCTHMDTLSSGTHSPSWLI